MLFFRMGESCIRPYIVLIVSNLLIKLIKKWKFLYYQVTIPVKVRKEMGIVSGSDIDIRKKGQKYVLIVNPSTVQSFEE